jgi:hypothetical protein
MMNFDDFMKRENKEEKQHKIQLHGKGNQIIIQEIYTEKKETIIKQFTLGGLNCRIKADIYGKEDINNLLKVNYINIVLLEIVNDEKKYYINLSYKNKNNNFEDGEFWTIFIDPSENMILELKKHEVFPDSSLIVEILITEATNRKIMSKIFL